MKMKSKKTAAVALAAVMMCGVFAGCDLVVKNNSENLKQTVAEVNITDSASFSKEFPDLTGEIVNKVISTAAVSKQDLIVSFLSSGNNLMNSYNYNYKETFDALAQSLVQHQVYIQYAKAYFLANGWTEEKEGEEPKQYAYNDLAAFNAAVKDKEGVEYDIAALGYFLTEDEKIKAEFTTRSMINNSIDSAEESYIKEEDDDKEVDSDVRTTPTGLNTTDSDFYDPDYRIYTGTGKQNAVRGSYEKKEGSTQTTRRRAYNDFLATLKANDLVQKGEDTSDVESLSYYKLEKKSDYEQALINKLADTFEKQAETTIDNDYCLRQFNSILADQRESFSASSSALESAMDSVSDSKFVLTATGNTNAESSYGFVINILLPFSTAQTDELSSVTQDYGDEKGNKFRTRAKLLEKIKATDQRGSWFRGETDHSYDASEDSERFTGATANADRKWLFFEDNLKDEASKNERLKNYLGKYTYNGTWNAETRKYKPNRITIDDFLAEMNAYLGTTGLSFGKLQYNSADVPTKSGAEYYAQTDYYYGADGTSWDGSSVKKGDVDYSKFIYAAGKITSFADEFDNANTAFDANQIFLAGSAENKAMSVINELAFAYNTDTSCLNKYFGYSVTANKTSFVSEFEYAAQLAVKCGAGSYVVVPSDYGWHIMYCTFSFVDSVEESGSIRTPYKFDIAQKDLEGSFSNLFYEAIKANTASTDSSNRRSKIVSLYNDSYEIFEDRYKDLADLDKNS